MSAYITVTPGKLIVSPTLTEMKNYLSIRVEDGPTLAVIPPKDGQPNYGDAAVMSAANEMFDLLNEIQIELLSSKEVIDLTDITRRISLICEKIAAEAGV